jgi:tetratricopeptide (TPR) repeat protein
MSGHPVHRKLPSRLHKASRLASVETAIRERYDLVVSAQNGFHRCGVGRMTVVRRGTWSVLVVAGLVSWSLGAHAALDEATRESIRLLANDAAADYDGGHYEQAKEKFQRAYDTAQVPTLALRLARAEIKLGHLVVANELLRQAGRLEKNELWVGSAQQDAQKQAAQELAELQPQIPRVVIRIRNGQRSRGVQLLHHELGASAAVEIGPFAQLASKRDIVVRIGDRSGTPPRAFSPRWG